MSNDNPTDRLLAVSAIFVVAGTVCSGPLGMLLTAIHRQPHWKDAQTFAENFHAVQQVPFWFGLVLLAACVFFVARASAVAAEHHRTRAIAASISVATYAAMVGTNYTLQIAWVPHLARLHDPSVAYVTMANPGAAAWALEMFGYGALGVATWLIAPVFRDGRFGVWISWLFVANGLVSIAGAVITGIHLPWVMSPAGFACFAAWNVLLIVAMALCATAYWPQVSSRASKRRLATSTMAR
jgi:hypothetical protein